MLDIPADATSVAPDILCALHEWTTPNRRKGDRHLNDIPTDIHLEILSYVTGQKNLSNLALVCRLFSVIVVRKRFEKISVNLTFQERSSGFYKALHTKHDPLAISLSGNVRECRVNGSFSNKEENISFISHVEDLLRMPNLQKITLHEVYLSPEILTQLSRLPGIRSLTLSDSEVGRLLSSEDIDAAAANLTRLESFSLSGLNRYAYQTDGPVTSKDFAPFVVNSHTTTLSTDSDDFFNHVATQRGVSPLRELSLHPINVVRLFNIFGSNFTTLVVLRLHNPKWPDDPGAQNIAGLFRSKTALREKSELTLPLSNLPHLRRLTCPASFAYLFSGPHALEEISFASSIMPSFDSHKHIIDDWSLCLSEGMRLFSDNPSANLRRLTSLSWGFLGRRPALDWSGKLQNWFPQLGHLEFNLRMIDFDERFDEMPDSWGFKDEFRDILKDFVDTWAPVKPIQEVVFKIDFFCVISVDKNWFHDCVMEFDIKNVFPNLRRIVFGDMVYNVCRRRPAFANDIV
ncbi:hypothetical protein D9757_006425 [Collybiopsis confluens]|uniref:F-box domain-containing protein n=1 Tax=Collybiopsis confluens TaxID=2823264 RepID=A0A8H5M8I3_9AGAR|nr:hypothetical protein D9757_006425 [Collybiopsis confluens]